MKSLICFTLLIAFAAVATAKMDKAKIKEFFGNMKSCAEELGIDLNSIHEGGLSNLKQVMDENPDKCMPKCLMQKYGIIDGDGHYDSSKAESLIPEGKEIDMDQVQACFDKSKHEEENCTKYMNIQKCLFKLKHH